MNSIPITTPGTVTVPVSIPGPAQINVTMTSTGPRGATGAPGGSSVTYPAGEVLAAGRVVIIDGGEAFYFQPSDATHQGRAYGVTLSAAALGANVSIQISGEVEHAAFTFGADAALYVYNNGIIVDTPPAATLVQGAGVASGAGKMKIDLSKSILTT